MTDHALPKEAAYKNHAESNSHAWLSSEHDPSRSPPINRLQPGRDAAAVDGISPVQAAARGGLDSATAAWPWRLHGWLACGQSDRHASQSVRTGSCTMECSTAAREYSRRHQHHG